MSFSKMLPTASRYDRRDTVKMDLHLTAVGTLCPVFSSSRTCCSSLRACKTQHRSPNALSQDGAVSFGTKSYLALPGAGGIQIEVAGSSMCSPWQEREVDRFGVSRGLQLEALLQAQASFGRLKSRECHLLLNPESSVLESEPYSREALKG